MFSKKHIFNLSQKESQEKQSGNHRYSTKILKNFSKCSSKIQICFNVDCPKKISFTKNRCRQQSSLFFPMQKKLDALRSTRNPLLCLYTALLVLLGFVSTISETDMRFSTIKKRFFILCEFWFRNSNKSRRYLKTHVVVDTSNCLYSAPFAYYEQMSGSKGT